MNQIISTRIWSIIGATLLALSAAVTAWVLLGPANSANASDSGLRPVATMSAAQVAAIPALRAPAAGSVPEAVQRFTANEFVATHFAPNPALARAVTVPGGGTQPWEVVPGKDSVCLTSGENNGGTCASLADAAAGKLFIQLVEPPDSQHAVPAPGQPVESTIVGVLPAGVSAVSAEAKGGAQAAGQVLTGGLYTVTGTNLTDVRLGGPEITPRAVAVAVK